jgi:transcriptional regulator with XRE-family HTH domain
MNNQTFAERLRDIRTRAGWSRAKMFDRVGVPQRTIEDWEASKRTPPEYVQKLVIDRMLLEIENDK